MEVASSKYRVAVLVSGAGSNMVALCRAFAGSLVDIALVVCNEPDAPALVRAREEGREVVVLPHRSFSSREVFDEALAAVLENRRIDLVVAAGFQRLLGAAFVKRFYGRLINLHPSLLPSFPGRDAIRAAYDARVCQTGCTVHFVDEGCDTGPIIAQEVVQCSLHETLDVWRQKIHAAEHRLLPHVVAALARGDISLQSRQVSWR